MTDTLTLTLPAGVSAIVKKGTTYYRLRYGTPRKEVILSGLKGELTPALLRAIELACEAHMTGVANAKPVGPKLIERKNVANPGTYGLAWRLYQQTEAWKNSSPSTQLNRRQLVEAFLDTKVLQGSDATWKEVAVGETSRRLLNGLLDATAERAQSQAFKLLIAIKRLCAIAVDEEWIKVAENPTYEMKRAKTRGRWPAWPVEQQAAFEARHPLGTTPRTAYELTKWLGQRQGDICQLRRSQIQVLRRIEGDRIVAERFFVIAQEKNAKRRAGGAKIAPVLITPMVDEAIAHIPAEQDYLLVTNKGTPYAKSGMTTAFADWREQAGLSRHGYSQHGLRKVLGGLMATAGCTTKENMAVLGHDDIKNAEIYSVDADAVKMSANAMGKVLKLVRPNAA